MDGVLAKFEPASIEEMTSPGFFISRKPDMPVIQMMEMVKQTSGMDVCILSAYLLPMSKDEKIQWNELFTGIPLENQFYVPYGQDKNEFLEKFGGVKPDDVLVDDFTKNLTTWNGIGVKLYNGINGSHGTWKGFPPERPPAPLRPKRPRMILPAARARAP